LLLGSIILARGAARLLFALLRLKSCSLPKIGPLLFDRDESPAEHQLLLPLRWGYFVHGNKPQHTIEAVESAGAVVKCL
jgi:hypothetical protein